MPGTGRILSSLETAAEAACRMEQVDVVGAHKVVRHADDGLVQRLLAVVVGRVEGNGTAQLRHSDLLPDILVQAGEEDLALARLEAVDERGDGALAVGDGKVDQFLVDKVTDRQLLDVVIYARLRLQRKSMHTGGQLLHWRCVSGGMIP